jgi:hypothetical protein
VKGSARVNNEKSRNEIKKRPEVEEEWRDEEEDERERERERENGKKDVRRRKE